ncbi:GTP cyclohydrolase I FolE [Priestia aryabhattai]|uniref:GTP cyclohydrolase I FolE n=1 Tax=Priestia aryabhattai TaxID=412384 RepID=UPI002E23E27F|nr:GTP cyclohydrolase I FolE [Priestia aryabhattai]MED4012953.1 GTP cyclohydrolase I FolE [Priestia aryabhattai]
MINTEVKEVDLGLIEDSIKNILIAVGEDPAREGLVDTPKRVAKMYQEIFSGLFEDPKNHLKTVFNESHEEMVIVKDIPFYSFCEHHLVPFYGKAHVGYIPQNGKLTGLSKIARTVETVARRPQLQERITTSVAEAIEEVLCPSGTIIVVEAEHMCMSMRGIKKPGSKTVTYSLHGEFKENEKLKSDFFNLIKL